MMFLKDTKLGDEIEVYLDSNGQVTFDNHTDNYVSAKVIGKYMSQFDEYTIIGWKDGLLGIPRAHKNSSTEYIKEEAEYTRCIACFHALDNIIHSVKLQGSQKSFGYQCSMCKEDFPYAEHNQIGPFICTGCKLWNGGT